MIIPQERQRMSVIGFRDASYPCLAGARTLAKFLAENGVVAVGGLVLGIGTMAHSVAMGHGRTVAVIGAPLDRTYPKDAVI